MAVKIEEAARGQIFALQASKAKIEGLAETHRHQMTQFFDKIRSVVLDLESAVFKEISDDLSNGTATIRDLIYSLEK